MEYSPISFMTSGLRTMSSIVLLVFVLIWHLARLTQILELRLDLMMSCYKSVPRQGPRKQAEININV